MVCQRPDWCSMSDDGVWAICRRVSAGGKAGVDRVGLEYWTHRVDGSSGPLRERWEPPVARADVAPSEFLDRVYRAVLAELPLADEHRAALRARGLDDLAIDDNGYRSLPRSGRAALAGRLADRFDRDRLLTVPGVGVRRDGERTWVSFGGPPGMLIPVRSVNDEIVALKVRADEVFEGGGRYCFVSSARYDGPSPAPAVHVPVWEARHTQVVRVTEGELKADVAGHLSGIRTISVPGIGGWRAAMPVLDELGRRGMTTVWLAFDRDWPPNPHTRAAIASFGAELHGRYAGGVEVWSHREGKGIDDVMAAGGSSLRLIGFPPADRARPGERGLTRDLQRG